MFALIIEQTEESGIKDALFKMLLYCFSIHECYTNGLVMTNRTLKTDELFQIRLDVIAQKYIGNVEFGVTQLTCNEVKYPYKISSIK